ncbi:MAG: response regulator [Planctomycetes bacterium]|nr:response regulator [Planctomycetota bacterium]
MAARTILVVDDDMDFRMQLRLQLEAAGFVVVEAEGLSQARQAMAAGRPDLIVVDLMMEHMDDGFTLCHEVKAKDVSLPVVMVTGVAAETGLKFDASTDGERAWVKADALLDKPVRFEQLKREIDRLLKG